MICLTDSSKLGEDLGFKEGASFGVPEWSIDGLIEGTILVHVEGFLYCSLLGISEWSPEGDKDIPLLGLKYNIRYGDKILTTVGNHNLIFEVINEYNADGNSEGLIIGLKEDVTFVLFVSTMIGLAGFSKLGEDIGFTWIEV